MIEVCFSLGVSCTPRRERSLMDLGSKLRMLSALRVIRMFRLVRLIRLLKMSANAQRTC